MLKKFTDGLIFGAGFGLAFTLVYIVALYFILPNLLESRTIKIPPKLESEELTNAPAIKLHKRFHGSQAITSSGFNKTSVLASGPGVIKGRVLSNNNPQAGLRLRLMLNGSAASQWATSGEDGYYSISVPYGDYVIEGFEIDYNTANKVLAGKIDHPNRTLFGETFKVDEDTVGQGLKLNYVDPVKKNISQKTYSVNDDIVLEWKPYPGAAHYRVQIIEKIDPSTWRNVRLFDWRDRPEVIEPKMMVKDHGVKLKPGHFYILEVTAYDENMHTISESIRKHSGYDFGITE